MTVDEYRRDVLRPIYTRAAELYATLPNFRYRWILFRGELEQFNRQVRELRLAIHNIDQDLAALAQTDAGANLNALAVTGITLSIVGRERDSIVALIDNVDRAVAQRVDEANVYAGISISVLSVLLAVVALLVAYFAWRYPEEPLSRPTTTSTVSPSSPGGTTTSTNTVGPTTTSSATPTSTSSPRVESEGRGRPSGSRTGARRPRTRTMRAR